MDRAKRRRLDHAKRDPFLEVALIGLRVRKQYDIPRDAFKLAWIWVPPCPEIDMPLPTIPVYSCIDMGAEGAETTLTVNTHKGPVTRIWETTGRGHVNLKRVYGNILWSSTCCYCECTPSHERTHWHHVYERPHHLIYSGDEDHPDAEEIKRENEETWDRYGRCIKYRVCAECYKRESE